MTEIISVWNNGGYLGDSGHQVELLYAAILKLSDDQSVQWQAKD